jgi:hypothetical protein
VTEKEKPFFDGTGPNGVTFVFNAMLVQHRNKHFFSFTRKRCHRRFLQCSTWLLPSHVWRASAVTVRWGLGSLEIIHSILNIIWLSGTMHARRAHAWTHKSLGRMRGGECEGGGDFGPPLAPVCCGARCHAGNWPSTGKSVATLHNACCRTHSDSQIAHEFREEHTMKCSFFLYDVELLIWSVLHVPAPWLSTKMEANCGPTWSHIHGHRSMWSCNRKLWLRSSNICLGPHLSI